VWKKPSNISQQSTPKKQKKNQYRTLETTGSNIFKMERNSLLAFKNGMGMLILGQIRATQRLVTDGSYYVEKDTKLVFRMWKQLSS
jgi:hypothetical protein